MESQDSKDFNLSHQKDPKGPTILCHREIYSFDEILQEKLPLSRLCKKIPTYLPTDDLTFFFRIIKSRIFVFSRKKENRPIFGRQNSCVQTFKILRNFKSQSLVCPFFREKIVNFDLICMSIVPRYFFPIFLFQVSWLCF